MADTPVHRVPQTVGAVVRFHVGQYVTTAALALLEHGVPVHEVTSTAPTTEAIGEDDPEEFWDACGSISFSRAYAAALKGPDCRLEWTAGSGWLLHPHFDVEFEGDEEPDYYADARWLADGLVPAPERVTQFLLTARERWDGAGSATRPCYRRPADGYGDLLEQLAAYQPGPLPYRLHFEDWQARFEYARENEYFWRTVEDLTADGPDPVVDVPLCRSETRALLRLLDLLQAYTNISTTDLVVAAAADLAARIDGDRNTAETHRTTRDVASRVQGWGRTP